MATPLFELSPTTRFGDRASDYARFRPSYPAAAIDYVLEGLGDPRALQAADVGAGTGIASRLLADRGVRVLAVEPNEAMRHKAEPHASVTFIPGAAEATGLEAGSVDMVICAQAFHWFRPAEALAEFQRILKPGGRLALVLNERDPDDAATRAYGAAIMAACDRELPEGSGLGIETALREAGRWVAPKSFPNSQALNPEGLIGRARSASYIHKEGPRYEQLLKDLEQLWADHHDSDRTVRIVYRTLVWRIDSAPRA